MDFKPDILKFSDGKPVLKDNVSLRRAEILDILRNEEYGYSPKAPEKVFGKITESEESCCSGHATLESIDISFETQKGMFSFPIKFFAPKKDNCPLIVLLNFRPDCYDKYFPAEEIIDNGFALAVIYYNDVALDSDDFTYGLASMYENDSNITWAKISMWAFSASRAIDYLITRKEVDKKNIAVAGHSRLGKTALWCGAQDERIKFTYSNDSGCGGAAYEGVKHKGSEKYEDLLYRFPYWFCDNFKKYSDIETKRNFDQHFLLSAIAPRYVLVGSASEDEWADPYSEQLCCIAASPMWTVQNLDGFNGSLDPFKVGQSSLNGHIGYHLRDGIHFFGRQDWIMLMKFINENK